MPGLACSRGRSPSCSQEQFLYVNRPGAAVFTLGADGKRQIPGLQPTAERPDEAFY